MPATHTRRVAGAASRNKHQRRQVCINWLAGFCPDGPACEKAHPVPEMQWRPDGTLRVRCCEMTSCHFCKQDGHVANACPNKPQTRSAQSIDTIASHVDPQSASGAAAIAAAQALAEQQAKGQSSDPEEQQRLLQQRQQMLERVAPNRNEIKCFACGQFGHMSGQVSRFPCSSLSNGPLKNRMCHSQIECAAHKSNVKFNGSARIQMRGHRNAATIGTSAV